MLPAIRAIATPKTLQVGYKTLILHRKSAVHVSRRDSERETCQWRFDRFLCAWEFEDASSPAAWPRASRRLRVLLKSRGSAASAAGARDCALPGGGHLIADRQPDVRRRLSAVS